MISKGLSNLLFMKNRRIKKTSQKNIYCGLTDKQLNTKLTQVEWGRELETK